MTDDLLLTNINLQSPKQSVICLKDVMTHIHDAPTFSPYSDEVLSFCSTFAYQLGRHAQGIPELQALAFWMRKSELYRLKTEFEKLLSDNVLLVPRGTVFHIPPANVDTIFVYSWLLSVLSGNKNMIRLSRRQSSQTELIIRVFNELVNSDEFSYFQNNTAMFSYDHNQDITTTFSELTDVRVIWGGDRTIQTIRQSPLLPHAIELTFSDKFSLATIHTETYLSSTSQEQDNLAEKFFNDAFWFDQLGCSSPRLIVWVGKKEDVQKASQIFYKKLQEIVRKKEYQVDTSTALNKLAFSYRAVLEHDVYDHNALSNELVVLPLKNFSDVRGEFCGSGLFFQVYCDNLEDIVPHIKRRDQTLSYYGFSENQLIDLIHKLNGHGVDRIVPFGEALTFNRYWDGFDLIQSFTRRVHYQV